jgi:hypothetical protein
MTEEQLQSRVMDYARLRGWRSVHFRPAQQRGRWVTAYTGDDGFPDLVLARGGRVLLAELKAEEGRFRPGQREWLEAAGDNGKLWRPSSWNEVLEVLK